MVGTVIAYLYGSDGGQMRRKYFIILSIVAFAAVLCSPTEGFASILGSTDNFAVLAGTTMTNTGPSTVVGDIGVYPGSAVTGYGSIAHTGALYLAPDAVALQAQSDLTTAYDNLAGMSVNGNLTGQDLGGLILAAGVYHFNSSAGLTGTLFLNAMGDNNASWVFQIESALTTASNSAVQWTNPGSNNSVFWQVGSSATLGTGTNFEGNILALSSITLDTGATISNGRALARNGAVTMDTNSINKMGGAEPSAVPEPSTILLFGLSGIVTAFIRRIRKA